MPFSRRRDQRGMLLFTVFIIATLLLIVALSLWQANQSDSGTIPNQIRRMQASFMAKGALQVALLKARLLVTPLYHASAFSVGKNPFYAHDAGYVHLDGLPPSGYVTAPGPAFLSGVVTLSGVDALRTRIKEIPGAPSNQALGDWDGDLVNDWIVDQHLTFFRLDVADSAYTYNLDINDGAGGQQSVTVGGQPSLSVSQTVPCPKFGGVDPYSGRFRVTKLSVEGGREGKMYREDAIVIVAEAEVTAAIAGVTETWRTEEKTIYRARRRYKFN